MIHFRQRVEIMKIVTWNVNSIRVRNPHVKQLIEKRKPQILCLQEIKAQDDTFICDNDRLTETSVNGQPAYNGVATLSKVKQFDVAINPFDRKLGSRVIASTISNIRVINIYVPNGGKDDEAYEAKLEWLAQLLAYVAEQKRKYKNVVLTGDFNICPSDRDVHNPKAWKDMVTCTVPERAAFSALINLGFADAFDLVRDPKNPEKTGGKYTWWDYRSGSFYRDKGLRIDHALVSTPLAPHVDRCEVLSHYRGLTRPSDHAPLLLRLSKDVFNPPF